MGPASSFASELNWLNNQIHLLDHRKGDAEKALAKIEEDMHRAGNRARGGKALMEARTLVLEMERSHDEYVEQIGALRDRAHVQMGDGNNGPASGNQKHNVPVSKALSHWAAAKPLPSSPLHTVPVQKSFHLITMVHHGRVQIFVVILPLEFHHRSGAFGAK